MTEQERASAISNVKIGDMVRFWMGDTIIRGEVFKINRKTFDVYDRKIDDERKIRVDKSLCYPYP